MMRCGYIILAFTMYLAAASPALYALACLRIGTALNDSVSVGGVVELIGWIELLTVGSIVVIIVLVEGFDVVLAKAKAELDALKSGMRDEK